MPKQLHRSFQDAQVRKFLVSYLDKAVKLPHLLQVLKIGRSRFFALLKAYRQDPENFTVAYRRRCATRTIDPAVRENILRELAFEKRLIADRRNPLRTYNYTYIKNRLWDTQGQKVSVPTIIKLAKENDFYRTRPRRKAHDRQVLTNYIGELIQHDSSEHLWAPLAEKKWHLITSLDDYSRRLLYADLVERETSWDHISALESVVLRYGVPARYYTDSHSIFRFVQGRDSNWRTHHLLTDDVDTQWRLVLKDLGIDPAHALSPQAKGKIERPYGWLQDHLVRTCARENIKAIQDAREILRLEVDRYNNHQVHSTTGEVPSYRFNSARREGKSLFRDFLLPPSVRSTKDIFCLRADRVADAYRQVSFNTLRFKLKGVSPGDSVQLRIVPDFGKGLAEIRFWQKKTFLGAQKIKLEDLKLVHF